VHRPVLPGLPRLGGCEVSLVDEWLVLLRVHEGGVTWMDGHYLNHGRPVAGYLAEAIEELIRAELLVLARPDPIGVQRVCVTHAGQVRYAELNSNGMWEARNGDG
jgi:hypothetical protein